jgi:anti-sigma B factor antagonist
MRSHASENVVDFRIDEERAEDGAVVLVLHGEADLHTAPLLRSHLEGTIDSDAPGVVVDLHDVPFFDSTALGVLVAGMKRLRATRRPLRLVAPRGEVRRLLELTLLDRVLAVDATRADALAQVGRVAESA